jgi:site-specific DNA recombinase
MTTVTEMNRRGWQTKSFTTKEGKVHAGHTWSKVTLKRLLTNRVYLGQIPYGNESFPGEHPAIIDEPIFQRVAESLAHGRDHGPARGRNSFAYLLRGLVYCKACGSAMVPATTKSPRQRSR